MNEQEENTDSQRPGKPGNATLPRDTLPSESETDFGPDVAELVNQIVTSTASFGEGQPPAGVSDRSVEEAGDNPMSRTTVIRDPSHDCGSRLLTPTSRYQRQHRAGEACAWSRACSRLERWRRRWPQEPLWACPWAAAEGWLVPNGRRPPVDLAAGVPTVVPVGRASVYWNDAEHRRYCADADGPVDPHTRHLTWHQRQPDGLAGACLKARQGHSQYLYLQRRDSGGLDGWEYQPADSWTDGEHLAYCDDREDQPPPTKQTASTVHYGWHLRQQDQPPCLKSRMEAAAYAYTRSHEGQLKGWEYRAFMSAEDHRQYCGDGQPPQTDPPSNAHYYWHLRNPADGGACEKGLMEVSAYSYFREHGNLDRWVYRRRD